MSLAAKKSECCQEKVRLAGIAIKRGIVVQCVEVYMVMSWNYGHDKITGYEPKLHGSWSL